jgi:hypothetical protein
MVKMGKILAKGTVKKIVLGFRPRAVEVVNETGLVTAFKSDTMDGSKGAKRVTNGTMTFPTDLITIESDGFTIGTDADLNAAGEALHYVAWQARNE